MSELLAGGGGTVVVLGEDVPAYARPDRSTKVVARLSCDVLRVASGDDLAGVELVPGWRGGHLPSGAVGFVESDRIAHPSLLLRIGKKAGKWTGAIARTMLEGQVVLRVPEPRRGRSAAGRRPLYADAPGGWVVAPLESAEPTADIASALAVVAQRLGRDDRIVAWGVSNGGGAFVVRILHTARLTARERFTDVGRIPVVWSELAKGAFERAGCSAAP